MAHRIVGKPIGRLDGIEKVSGEARYSGDVTLPGLVWGKALRSPLPHARILRIDTSKAKVLAGVLAVLTARDLPNILVGRRMFDMPLLARDRVRFIGERVAVVAALDPDIAEEALALIDVEYEDLPAVFDPVEAIQDGAPILHENPGAYDGAPPERPHPNVQSVLRFKLGDVEAGLRAADRVFEHTFRTQLDHQGYLEPHAGVVGIDEDGRIQVWASNKMPFRLKELLSQALQLPPAQIRVNLTPIGGDFGGKGFSLDEFVGFYLARATGRPVRSVMSYVEELSGAGPRHAAELTLRTAVSADGTFLAHEADVVFDGGAYAAGKAAPDLVPHGGLDTMSAYSIPTTRHRLRTVYTNSVPGGHMRAPGEVQAVFAGETQDRKSVV